MTNSSRARRWIRTAGAAAALLLAATAGHAAPASSPATIVPLAVRASLDFLWSPDPDNDTQVYLHISNMAFEPPRDQVRSIYPKLKFPESDFPVLVFLAREARVSLGAVFRLRSKGLSWVEVMVRLGVPHERVFVGLRRDPGPPYGKAYGHWKKRSHDRVVLTDDDVFFWVNVRAMSAYFGVDPTVIVEWREGGRTWKAISANEFRGRKGHGKEKHLEKAGAGAEKGQPGQSKSKGKGGRP